MTNYPKTLFAAGDLSGNLTSDDCDITNMYGYSLQLNFTGTATGNITVQGSNDVKNEMPGNAIANWATIATFALAAPGSIMYNVDACHYRHFRFSYSATGGNGTLIAKVNAKGS